MSQADERTPLLQHLEELRARLVRALLAVLVGFALCYSRVEQIFAWLVKPYRQAVPDAPLIMIRLTEGFMTYLKLGIWSGLLVASPFVIYQVWAFIAPGLYRHERRLIMPLVMFSSVLFVAGAAFTYYLVLPFGMKYLIQMAGPEVTTMLSMSSYVSSACLFMAVFGLLFQIPLVMLVLGRVGLIRPATLARNRKYVLLGSFVLGAVLSPPDVVSQSLVSVPLFLLFEASIWVMRISDLAWRRPAAPAPAETAAPPGGGT